jgi:hypothetical protein
LVNARCGVALAALAALAALVPASALGDAAIYLTWNDCALGAEAASDFAFPCDTDDGFEELFCAFAVPATTTDVLGIIAVVDLQTAAATVPDWWRLAAAGGCRSGYLSTSGDFTQNASCVDPWLGQAAAEVQAYDVGEPHTASQARIKVVCGVTPDLARTLEPTGVYYGVKLVIRNTLSTGAGACVGCGDGACLVLNSIDVVRATDSIILKTPAPGNLNWARWHGGAGADCMLVPVRSLTWGGVKSLYR